MKHPKRSLLLAAAVVSGSLTFAQTPDSDGHVLTALWKEYKAASDADLPKKEAEILAKIRNEAAARRLTVDFYDAATRYVDAVVRRNWKEREKENSALAEYVKAYDEPVVTFLWMAEYQRPGQKALLAYVQEHADGMAGHNEAFYTRGISGRYFGGALKHFMASDLEYALWRLLSSNRDDAVYKMLSPLVAGRYPNECALAFYTLPYGDGRKAALDVLVEQYKGTAASFYPLAESLRMEFSDMQKKPATSAEFKAFHERCAAYEKQRAAFTGDEKKIAESCTGIKSLCESLTEKNLSVHFSEGKAVVCFRNLPSASLTLHESGKTPTLKSWELKNPKGSFYVTDTVSVDIPTLRDGTYTFAVKNGKITAETRYTQYTLSAALRCYADGWRIYVADYRTGKPLTGKVSVQVNKKGKEYSKADATLSQGFTLLPESLRKAIDGAGTWVSVSVQSGSRLSKETEVYPESYRPDVEQDQEYTFLRILRDQGAYRPGETVRFKTLYGKGSADKGYQILGSKSLKATFYDSESNEIASLALKTNLLGSASGEFAIPKDLRGGYFSIRITSGKQYLGSESFRVDEFAIPTFDLTFEKSNQLFLVGDEVPILGTLKSYSGHPLSGSTLRLKVSRWGTPVVEEEVPFDAATGKFSYAFKAADSGYYAITAEVVDPTGETLSFNSAVWVGDEVSLGMEVRETLEGRFALKDEPSGYRWGWRRPQRSVIATDTARVLVTAKNSNGEVIPELPLTYTLMDISRKDTVTVCTGSALSGEEIALPLPAANALYALQLKSTQKNGLGKTVETDQTCQILRLGSGSLPERLAYVYARPATQESGHIRFAIGASDAEQWTSVVVHDAKARALSNQVIRSAVRELKWVDIPAEAAWPEELSVSLFSFKNATTQSFGFDLTLPKAEAQLPLTLTRFVDSSLPGAEYSFTLQTSPDAEVLVAAWDKAIDAIQSNPWRAISLPKPSMPSVNTAFATGFVDGRNKVDEDDLDFIEEAAVMYDEAAPAVVGYGVASAKQKNAAVMMTRSVETEEAEESADDAGGEGGAEPVIRSEFATALTFQPHLRPNADGSLTVSFRTSDKLSTYWLGVFAHDQHLHSTALQKEILVTIPVKVSLLEPRYLYAGDAYEAAVTVSSNAGKPVNGTVRLVAAYNPSLVSSAISTREFSQAVELAPGGTAVVRFPIDALEMTPAFVGDRGNLTLTATFVSAGFSDGMKVDVPVYPAAQTLTEAHSAVLHAGADRQALLSDLLGRFVNVPGSEATLRDISILDMVKEAIPTKVEPAGNDVLSLSEAWYVRLLSGKLLGQSFDSAELLEKILACRNADGGFAWFEGMESSPMMTAVVLERMAKIAAQGFSVPDMTAAVRYLDKSRFDTSFPAWRCGISSAQYMYVRSMYPAVPFAYEPVGKVAEKAFAEFKKAAADYLTPKKERGLSGQILAKARRLLTLRQLDASAEGKALAKAWGVTPSKLTASLNADIRSLAEYAVEHRDGGQYFPNAVMPWRGLLESEAYAHALLCDLFDQTHPDISDGVRLWLMLQKETQKWDSDPAFVDAIASILNGSEAVLDTRVLALSATYTAPFSDIQAAGNGFTVERHFFRENGEELAEGDEVKIGERIRAEYRIWNAENRSFVRLSAGREASLRPVEQLSGFIRRGYIRPLRTGVALTFSPYGYRHVKTERTDYFFDAYPEESTVLSEEFFVQLAGRFTAPVVTIESLYAPHYRANSSSRAPLVARP